MVSLESMGRYDGDSDNMIFRYIPIVIRTRAKKATFPLFDVCLDDTGELIPSRVPDFVEFVKESFSDYGVKAVPLDETNITEKVRNALYPILWNGRLFVIPCLVNAFEIGDFELQIAEGLERPF